MTERVLPDFIVIGAIKAATTWISHQLEVHPDVHMRQVEPHFFSTEYDRGLDWYSDFLAGAREGQKIGEKSADYLGHPDAARRIAEVVPEARLVVQLRNPIDRAYSDYCMLYRRGTVNGDAARYFDRASTPQPRFLDDGLYGRHLRRWLDYFPRAQIKILRHEDIKERPAEVIAEVCGHLGIAPHAAPEAVIARVNDGATPILPLPIRKALAPVKDMVAPFRDQPWFKAVRGTMAREITYPPLTPDLRRRIRDFYVDDVEMLSGLIDRDVSHWLAIDEQPG